VFSPGNLTANNTDEALEELVPGARAHYFYDRFLVTRTTRLPANFSSITRFSFQVSDHNLANSEQLGGGGIGSVRGYYTNTALGSEGVLGSQEFRIPPFSIFRFEDQAQFGAFFDYAHLTQKTPIPNAPETIDLSSVGVDAHYLISRYLAFEFDLGCRLRRTELQPHLGAYGQVSLTVSY
jgi:hemolysin activation/secretion protein